MKLKTDYVDILLLHEATIDDLSDELLKKLQDLIREGKVRRIGVGTDVESLRRIAEARLQFEVYQRPWSVLIADENLLADHYQIFHGSILSAVGPVGEKLRNNAEALSHVQALCGLECRSSEDVAKVLLLSAVSANPGGLVLFSSRAPARVASYLKFARERAANVTPDLVVTLRSYLSLPC
jgi:diketogulonate reductase-like aldo/keto reductase